MSHIASSFGRSGAQTASYGRLHDEDRHRPDPSHLLALPRKLLRVTRFNRVLVCLLLIDLMVVGMLIITLEPLITLLHRNDELFRPSILSPQDGPSTAPHQPTSPKIPRILHQTCANATVPHKWLESQQSCKDVYADFEYKLWTDDTAREFLSVEYPWFVDTWDGYVFPIQRADSIRYFILHHYGGVYLDMDTICNESLPLQELESGPSEHVALFQSTLPTGVTNDLLVSSARHPAYATAISQLPFFHHLTRFWARLMPYCAIMMSSGPLFLSLMVKDYLIHQPSLPSPTVQVVDPDQLTPYITDLQSSTWHQADARALMWLGRRPWTWYTLGAMALMPILLIINTSALALYRAIVRRVSCGDVEEKLAKLA